MLFFAISTVASVDAIECREVATIDNSSRLHLLNWCRMVFPTSSPGARSARQFEGAFCLCGNGQLGREPGQFQVPALGKLANV